MKELETKEKNDIKNVHFENVETVIYSEHDTETGDIIRLTAQPFTKKKKKWVDILSNPASITSLIITLAGILLNSFYSYQYTTVLIIIGILIFFFLAIIKLKD